MDDYRSILITHLILYAILVVVVFIILGAILWLILSHLISVLKDEKKKKHKRGKRLARKRTIRWMLLSVLVIPLIIFAFFMALVPFMNLCMDIHDESYITYYGEYEYRDFWGWDQNCVVLYDDGNRSLNVATDGFSKESMITEERYGHVAYIGSGYVVYSEHSMLVVYIGETLE